MKPQAKKPILTVVAGLTLLGTAGCGSDGAADNPAGTPSSTPASSPASAPLESGAAAGTGTYADGEYTGTGTYIPPSNQQEEVTVKVTLSGGTVTALEVTPSGNNPTSKRYQAEFTDGIQEQVVGKPLDSLDVGKVAGSSLTSQGFNKALEMVKGEAAS
ncbi:FMN-binding protein [Arthrobacter sp. Sa2BUA2]|uniref:FMN-binding protein n=1 Tax=Arthrobacter pullicola TaxID=2762224 RepID=A0ABR8YJP7_9MICC|nr:FMN-binding protein [Arthrobacter pullicola]MBD8044273.1 FMN-binding protein [Arthrobacter pullicola]